MEKQIVECIPNFSEGKNVQVIEQIVQAVQLPGVKVLHVDRGEAANRTVVTFAGEPDAVYEAAFRAVKTAGEVIDMRHHHGEHPRIGATDVLPFVPVAGISWEECAQRARVLAQRIWEELAIPCYCYEASAYVPEHRNLAECRKGEYESLPQKMVDPNRMPDFGGGAYTEKVAQSGATVIGARNYLIAVNFNLDSSSAETATEIAGDVRESGRVVHEADGTIRKDEKGKTVRTHGTLKGCKAIGWYIEEYGKAQVSMNMTDIHATALHEAYEEVCRRALAHGTRVTGTEIIGLVPMECLLKAGRHFAQKKGLSTVLSEEQLIALAIEGMGLADLCPFEPDKKIIERLLDE